MKKVLFFIMYFCVVFSMNAVDIFMLAQTGTPKEVQAAITGGAKVNATAKSPLGTDWSPLMFSLMNDDPAVLSVLIKAGANVKFVETTKGLVTNTPLILAASKENSAFTKILIDAGADVNFPEFNGFPPLLFAASNKNAEVTRLLLAAGAKVTLKPDAEGNPRSALVNAVFYNPNIEVVDLLIKAGADPNQVAVYSISGTHSPLGAAAAGNKPAEFYSHLIKAGANPNQAESAASGMMALFGAIGLTETPFEVALKLTERGDAMSALIAGGADVNKLMQNGYTPLMVAAGNNPCLETIEALLKAGARVNDANTNGATPLVFAANSNMNPLIITALIKAGANMKLKTAEGMTPYEYALKNSSLTDTPQLEALKKGAGL